MIPGEYFLADGDDRAERRARPRRACASTTPATGRFRSDRTPTSSKSTARCASIARRRTACGSTSRPAPRCASSRATRARSSWSRSADAARLRPERAGRRPARRRARPRWRRARRGFTEDRDEDPAPHLRRPLRPDDRRSRPPRRHRSDPRRSSATSRRYGDEVEVRRRQGHSRRQGQSQVTRADGAPDLVITNAIILDHWGIDKADVGVRDGRISAIGKAGNPDIMDGVTPGLAIGAVDRNHRRRAPHPHRRRHRLARPLHLPAADPRSALHRHHHADRRRHRAGDGTKATTCTPGEWNIRRMLEAAEALPLNFGFLGKGNASQPRAAARADPRRRARPQAARGLGHDAGRDRHGARRSPTSTTSRSRFTPTR